MRGPTGFSIKRAGGVTEHRKAEGAGIGAVGALMLIPLFLVAARDGGADGWTLLAVLLYWPAVWAVQYLLFLFSLAMYKGRHTR